MGTDIRIPDDDTLGADPPTRLLATQLLPLLYDDLKRLARRERYRLRAGDTLQTTALIHDAYLKLHRAAPYNDRQHFLRASALAMRHILVNYVRGRLTGKRGAGAPQVPLDVAIEVAGTSDETLLDVNDALRRLAQLNPRLAQVVECRYFAGYEEEETAAALGLNVRTVRRDWVKARAWLRRELGSGEARSDTLPP